ncbi:hypothetical protein LLB_1075 [Legionella longbeachae D-4968]|nr:hypothetical protein LLB_1075 [Legionella longbeachae D-4968]
MYHLHYTPLLHIDWIILFSRYAEEVKIVLIAGMANTIRAY